MARTTGQPCYKHLVCLPCQASLSLNIVMRVDPVTDQLIADSLNWSEQLRSKKLAGCDDVIMMVSKMSKMPAFIGAISGELAASKLVRLCEEWGLRWQGKAIEKQTWLAIQSILPFCQDDGILSAIGDIRSLYPDIDQLTKLGKVCKAASSFIKGGLLIDEFQEKRATNTALEWAFLWFRQGIMFQDFEKCDVNSVWMVGNRQSDAGAFQVYFRKLQVLDFIWKHYRSAAAHAPDAARAVWEKFASLRVFISWAAADDFWKKSVGAGFINGQKGVYHWTITKFQEFCQTLPSQTVVAFAELIYGIMTTQFDEVLCAHVQQYPDGGQADYDSIANLLRGTGNQNLLTAAFQKYTKELAGQAVPLVPGQPLADLSQMASVGILEADDADQAQEQEEKKQLYDKLVVDRQNGVRLHALPGSLPSGPLQNFMTTGELNKILTNCPFHSPAQLGPEEKVTSRAWLISADLFPGCMAGGANDFRLRPSLFNETVVPPALKALWQWVNSVRKADDSIIVFDGRFSQVRRYFDAELSKLGQTFFLEMWIIYETPEPGTDVRYPHRQKAFSAINREVILVYRPIHRKKNTRIARNAFNACGETSSFDLTYTGVQIRTLGEIPKLTPTDKKRMMGADMEVPLSYTGEDKPLVADGVPFSWMESKPVSWWASFFKDLSIDHVFDTTTGSAAAAIGAHYAGVQYDGICCNELHRTWCEQLMNQAMFAVAADGGAGATPEFIKKVMHFFGPSVDQGMRMLKNASQDKIKAPAKAEEPKPESEEGSEGSDDGFND